MALLIDIEGIDGAGKGTQARRLCEQLSASGVSAGLISFPRYEATLFGRAVGRYLDGRFGSLDEVHPFLVSLLFAGDRFESRKHLLEMLAAHQVVVLDRYVASNVAHQAAKLEGAEREELILQIETIEYEIFALPRPDVALLLDLPVEAARSLISRKPGRAYTERAADIQEADGRYLERVREVYLALARSRPGWQVVECFRGGTIRTIEEIGEEIWSLVARRLM